MGQQEKELQKQIELVKNRMMESFTNNCDDDFNDDNNGLDQQNKQDDDDVDDDLTQQDLKEFKNKLQKDFLDSDNSVKIAKLPSPKISKPKEPFSVT